MCVCVRNLLFISIFSQFIFVTQRIVGTHYTVVEWFCSFCPTFPSPPFALSPPLSPHRLPSLPVAPPSLCQAFPVTLSPPLSLCQASPVGSLVSLSYIHDLEFIFCQARLFSCHHWQRELF